MIDKLNFLLGKWDLDYKIPESILSKADSGEGHGEFKKILNDKYIEFNYSAKLSSGEYSAHALCTWDEAAKLYRYWWFEDSGAFMTASCNFSDENTFHMNWHNSLLVQIFKKISDSKISLLMSHPSEGGSFKTVLDVTFSHK